MNASRIEDLRAKTEGKGRFPHTAIIQSHDRGSPVLVWLYAASINRVQDVVAAQVPDAHDFMFVLVGHQHAYS